MPANDGGGVKAIAGITHITARRLSYTGIFAQNIYNRAHTKKIRKKLPRIGPNLGSPNTNSPPHDI